MTTASGMEEEKLITHTLLMRIQNGTDTLENSSHFLEKHTHKYTIWPSNCTSGHLSQSYRELCPHKNLYTNIYNSLIHNAQNYKQPRGPSIGECTNSGTSVSENSTHQ